MKKQKAVILTLAMCAVFLAPSAQAAQSEEQTIASNENCLVAMEEFFADQITNAEIGHLFEKQGFIKEDRHLYHYTDGQRDIYPSGFVTIEDKLYYVPEEGSEIRSEKGFCEIDGGLFYITKDGSLLRNDTVGRLEFGSGGRYTSGNPVLDQYVDQVLTECTTPDMTQKEKLRAAYQYILDHGAYVAQPHQARGSTDWAEESALFMFEHKKANCYGFAGQFMYLARRLGYDAYVVSGGVGRKNKDHAWVMIHEKGWPYIYDVELEWGYRSGKYGHGAYDMFQMPLYDTVFRYIFPCVLR